MRGMHIARLVILSVTCLFALIVLGVNGAYLGTVSSTQLFDGFARVTMPVAFAGFNIFVALLTLLLLTPMIVTDFLRQGAFTSMILTELIVLGVLDIFWLVSAAYTTSVLTSNSDFCSLNTNVHSVSSACTDMQASTAFCWLNWIMLMAYSATLLTFSILYANRGSPIWKKSVSFVSVATLKPVSSGKSADYYSPATAPAPIPLMQATPAGVMQSQPQVQQYGSPLYPPQPTGMAYTGSSLRAEV